jgi:SEC-C motif-containing protein
MNDHSACPCGSGAVFAACCGPVHAGHAEPVSAEWLMRSRFSAFARGAVDWLWTSLHPDHDDRAEPRETVLDHLRRGLAQGLRYEALAILDTRPPDAEGVAQVLFHATVRAKGRDLSFVELSSFAHDGSGWRYLFGVPVRRERLRGDPRRLTIADVAPDETGHRAP